MSQGKTRNALEDTLLTTSFDNQLKLVEKSLEDKGGHVFTNRSCKLRYDAGDDDCDNVVKPSASTKTKTPATSTITATTTDNNTTKKATPKAKKPTGCIMPPPSPPTSFPVIEGEDEARASMMMSWYMAGYHTGYFEAMRKFKN